MSISSTDPNLRRRLSMRETAHRLGCSQRYLYQMANDGEIPTYFAAGHRWVDEEDIDAYLARCKAAGPQFRKIGYATRKRKPGRPKKPKPETATASAAE
jgi:excisionase family DNA binding protein